MNKWILINDKSFSLTKSDLFRPKTNILENEKIELEPISEETILDTEKKISLNSMYTQVDSNDFDIIEKEEPEILETITVYKKKDVTLNNIYNNLVPIMNTVAGNGISGYEGDGGNASDAKLNKPYAVIVDSQETMYIAERNNNIIRKISKNGIISTYAGNRTSGYYGDNISCIDSLLYFPVSLAFDSKENLYFGDGMNYSIRKIDRDTEIINTIVGTGTCGICEDGHLAKYSSIGGTGIAFDQNDNLYITDTKNNCILMVFNGKSNSLIDVLIGKLTQEDVGKIFTIIGNKSSIYSGDNGPANKAGLVQPLDIAIDIMNNVYIVDHINSVIRKVYAVNGVIKRFAGQLIMQKNKTNIKTNTLNESKIQKMSTIDGVVSVNNNIQYFGDGGIALNAKLNKPFSVAVDSLQNVYISDRDNNVIRKITNGIISTVGGVGLKGYSGDDGPAKMAKINEPHRISVDSKKNIYVADTMNNVIRKILMYN